MLFKTIISNALKGQNHQRRATPCDWRTVTSQALNRKPEKMSSTNVKGHKQIQRLLSPFQSFHPHVLSLQLFIFHS